MGKASTKTLPGARERLLEASYALFAQRGVAQVGIEAILEKSNCARASLYSHFDSKAQLAIAFLDRREEIWTRAWLETQVKSRSPDPSERLLLVFDVFDGWFRKKDFEGCSFVNVLLESAPGTPLHRSAAAHLAKIRAIIGDLAREAELAEPEKFAAAWHMLMKGSIVAACEGDKDAARAAKAAAALVLEGWARL